MSRILLFVLFTFSFSLELPAQRTKKYRSYQKRGKKYRTTTRRRRGRSPASIKKKAPPAKTFTMFDKSPHPHYDKFKQMSAEDQLKVMVLFMKLYGMMEGMTKYKKMYPKNKLKSKQLKTKKMKKTVKLILDLFLGADAVAQVPASAAINYTSKQNTATDDDTCYFAGWESYYVQQGGKAYCTKPAYISGSKDSFFQDTKSEYNDENNHTTFLKFVITDKTTGEGHWDETANSCKKNDENVSADYILCNPSLYGQGENNGMKICVPAGTKWSANSSAQCHDGFMKYNHKYNFLDGVIQRMDENPNTFEKLVSRLFVTCFCTNKSYYHLTTVDNPPPKCQDNTDPDFDLRECTYKERTMYHSTCFGLMGQFHALNNMHTACGVDNTSTHQNLIKSMQTPLQEIFGTWNEQDHRANWSDDAQTKEHNSIRYKHDRAYEKYSDRLKSVIDNPDYQKYYCEGDGTTPGNGKVCLCSELSPYDAKGITVEKTGCNQNTDGSLTKENHDPKLCNLAVCQCGQKNHENVDVTVDNFENCVEEDKFDEIKRIMKIEGTITHDAQACNPDPDTKKPYCPCPDGQEMKADANINGGDCIDAGKLANHTQLNTDFEAEKASDANLTIESWFADKYEASPDKCKNEETEKTYCACQEGETMNADGKLEEGDCLDPEKIADHAGLKTEFEEYKTENPTPDITLDDWFKKTYKEAAADSDQCKEDNGPETTEDDGSGNYSIFICFEDNTKANILAYVFDPKTNKPTSDLPPHTIELQVMVNGTKSKDEKFKPVEDGDEDKLDTQLKKTNPDYPTKEEIEEAKEELKQGKKDNEPEATIQTMEEDLEKLEKKQEEIRNAFYATLDTKLQDFDEDKLTEFFKDADGLCKDDLGDPNQSWIHGQKDAKFTAQLKIKDSTADSNELVIGDPNPAIDNSLGNQTPIPLQQVGDDTLWGRP